MGSGSCEILSTGIMDRFYPAAAADINCNLDTVTACADPFD